MANLIIEIREGDSVRTQSGTSNRTGKPYSIRKQEGWFHSKTEPYPSKVELNLADNQPPYAPGLYQIDFDQSVFVDRYNSLQLGRLQLQRQAPKEVSKAS